MIEREDLRRIHLLEHLSDDMLDALIPLIDLHEFEEGHLLYRQGELADSFFMVRRGKLLLEQKITSKATVTVRTLTPGDSLGLPSLVGQRLYNFDAICAEPCEFFVVKGEDLMNLLDQNHHMGYQMMKKLVVILNNQLERRTEQFLRSIKTHPDMSELD